MISGKYKFGLIAFAVILVSSMFVCCVNVNAEEPEMEWSKTFGGPYWDEGHAVQQTSDGGLHYNRQNRVFWSWQG